MSDPLLGNLLTAVGMLGTWYFAVQKFRREDRERHDIQHSQNLRRMEKLERCVHRHLGNDDDDAIRDRVLKVEESVKHLTTELHRLG